MRLDPTLAITHRQGPALARFVIAGLLHFRFEADVAPHVVFVGAAFEVRMQLVALGVELAPVVAGLERVGIEMVGRIDTAAGISVFVPGAADGVVLLEDHEPDAGFAQLDGGAQARHARTDHRDFQFRLGRGGRRTPGLVGQAHFIERQRQVFIGDGFADTHAHHLLQQFVRGLLGPGSAIGGQAADHLDEAVVNRRHQLRRR